LLVQPLQSHHMGLIGSQGCNTFCVFVILYE
jgi:hypothetical protein